MKKPVLLLVSSLLLLGACTPGGNKSSNPGGDTSSEVETMPTVEEVVDYFNNGKYTMTVCAESYATEDDDESEELVFQVRYDEDKLAYAKHFYGEQGDYFVDQYYARFENNITYSIYEYYDFWVEEEGTIDELVPTFEFSYALVSLLRDLEVKEQAPWVYDEEHASYHAEVQESGTTYKYDVELCHLFFKQMKMESLYSSGRREVVTVDVTEIGTATVVLPETNITFMFNEFQKILAAMDQVTSYTLTNEVVNYTSTSSTSSVITYKVIIDKENRAILVEKKINNGSPYHFQDKWDEDGNHTYRHLTEDGLWETVSEEHYNNAVQMAFVGNDLSFFEDQFSVALFASAVLVAVQGDIKFKSYDEEIHDDVEFDITYNENYQLEGFDCRKPGRNEFNTYSAINETEIVILK